MTTRPAPADPFLDPAGVHDPLAVEFGAPTRGPNHPVDLRPDRDDPCGCGYDLCGQCMRHAGPRRHMIVPGVVRAH